MIRTGSGNAEDGGDRSDRRKHAGEDEAFATISCGGQLMIWRGKLRERGEAQRKVRLGGHPFVKSEVQLVFFFHFVGAVGDLGFTGGALSDRVGRRWLNRGRLFNKFLKIFVIEQSNKTGSNKCTNIELRLGSTV